MHLMFYIFYSFNARQKPCAANAQPMVHIVRKYRGMQAHRSARSRTLPEWRCELITSLESRPEVRFRRVRPYELVMPGDYIKDSERSYQPWDGPRGFRAASFVKEVYRPEQKRSHVKA